MFRKLFLVTFTAVGLTACIPPQLEVWEGEADCDGERVDLEIIISSPEEESQGFFKIIEGNDDIIFEITDLDIDGDDYTFSFDDVLEADLKRDGDSLEGDIEPEGEAACDADFELE